MSDHSDITDRSFSLPDTGLYASPKYWDDQLCQLYSESDYIDEIDSYITRNGDVRSSSRRPGHLITSVANRSSYQMYTSPSEVMCSSPMDVMSQAMFEPDITRDVSAAVDPVDTKDFFWAWEIIDQPEFYDNQNQNERNHSHGSVQNEDAPRDHPLYVQATTGPDGLYHCPWEGRDLDCPHKPEKLKCNYDKFVDSHLKPYRCKVHACENARFSSTACLLRHEREAHAMHGHGEKPFLCTVDGCERSAPGNGFPRDWNLIDHLKRVHNCSTSPPIGAAKLPRGSTKRKNATGERSAGKKPATAATVSVTVTTPPATVYSWSPMGQYRIGYQRLLAEVKDLPADLEGVESIEKRLERAAKHLKLMTQSFQQVKLGLEEPPP